MGANSLAKGSLELVANAAGWMDGLAKADSGLDKWAKNAGLVADKAAKSMNDKAAKIKMPEWQVPSSIAGVQAAILPTNLAAGLSLVKDIAGAFSAVLDRLMLTVQASRELGQTVAGFSSLEQAAKQVGLQTNDLQSSIVALEDKLNSSEAGDFFRKLGLDAAQLRQQDIVGKFAQISDAYKKMADGGQKNALFAELFLGSSVKVIPFLKEGGDLIRKNAAEAIDKGAALTEEGAARMKEAARELERAGQTWSGVGNNLAWVGAKLTNDFVEGGRLTFKGLNYAADSLSWGVGLGSRLNPDYGKPPAMPKPTAWTADQLKAMRAPGSQIDPFSVKMKPILDKMATKEAGDQINQELNRVNLTHIVAANTFKDEYKNVLRDVGATGPELKLFALEKQIGKGQLLDSLKEIKSEANAVALGLVELSPLQLFDKQLDALQGARAKLGDERYLLGVNKATQGLIQAAGVGPQRAVAGLQKDSSAAVQAQIASQLQQDFDNDPAAQLREAQNALLEQAKQQNIYGSRIAEYLRKLAEKADEEEEEY